MNASADPFPVIPAKTEGNSRAIIAHSDFRQASAMLRQIASRFRTI
jgi:hypothetical protein